MEWSELGRLFVMLHLVSEKLKDKKRKEKKIKFETHTWFCCWFAYSFLWQFFYLYTQEKGKRKPMFLIVLISENKG